MINSIITQTNKNHHVLIQILLSAGNKLQNNLFW